MALSGVSEVRRTVHSQLKDKNCQLEDMQAEEEKSRRGHTLAKDEFAQSKVRPKAGGRQEAGRRQAGEAVNAEAGRMQERG